MPLTFPSPESIAQIESPDLLDIPLGEIAVDLIECAAWRFQHNSSTPIRPEDDTRIGHFNAQLHTSHWGRPGGQAEEIHRIFSLTVTDQAAAISRSLKLNVSRGSDYVKPAILHAAETIAVTIDTADTRMVINRSCGSSEANEWGPPSIMISSTTGIHQIFMSGREGFLQVSEFDDEGIRPRSGLIPTEQENELYQTICAASLFDKVPGYLAELRGRELELQMRERYRDMRVWERT